MSGRDPDKEAVLSPTLSDGHSSMFIGPQSSAESVEDSTHGVSLFGQERKIGVHEISPPTVGSSGENLISRIRSSFLGRMYLGYLKRFPVIRGAAIWLWVNGYPLVQRYIVVPISFVRLLFDEQRRSRLRWRELVSQSDYLVRNAGQPCRLAAETEVDTPIPLAFPEEDRRYLVAPHERYVFPEILVAEVPGAMVHGGSNLVLAGDVVLHHDLYDFPRDSTSEELHGRTLIDPKRGRIRWLLHDQAPEHMACAAVFTDACAANYAHWLTEVLPRIAMFCAEERFAEVPLIVDSGLHINLMESLLLVAGGEREIICLPIGRAIAVERLYVTTACGYVPFGRRNAKLAGHSHGVFSPVALEKVRTRLIEVARGPGGGNDWTEKIYLRRTSGTRKVVNVAEIEKLLVSHGFSVVEPEKLSFLDQVRLFSKVKVVVGSSGAALANALLCNKKTRVIVLMGKHSDMIYRYWQNMLAWADIEVIYVLGSIVDNNGLGIHGDFMVDICDFGDLLSYKVE